MENNNLESTSVEFQYGKQTVKIETNKIARQATAAVVVTCLLYTSPSPRDY